MTIGFNSNYYFGSKGVGNSGGTTGTTEAGSTENGASVSSSNNNSEVSKFKLLYQSKFNEIQGKIESLRYKLEYSLKQPVLKEVNPNDFKTNEDYETAKKEAENVYQREMEEYKNKCESINLEIEKLIEIQKKYQEILDKLNEVEGENIPDDAKEAIESIDKSADDILKQTAEMRQIKTILSKIQENIAKIKSEMETLANIKMPELSKFIKDDKFDAEGYKAEVRKYVDARERMAELAKALEMFEKQAQDLDQADKTITSILAGNPVSTKNLSEYLKNVLNKAQDSIGNVEKQLEKTDNSIEAADKDYNNATESKMIAEDYMKAKNSIRNRRADLNIQLIKLTEELRNIDVLEFPNLDDYINADGTVREDEFAEKVIEFVKMEKQIEEISAKIDKINEELEKLAKEEQELDDSMAKFVSNFENVEENISNDDNPPVIPPKDGDGDEVHKECIPNDDGEHKECIPNDDNPPVIPPKDGDGDEVYAENIPNDDGEQYIDNINIANLDINNDGTVTEDEVDAYLYNIEKELSDLEKEQDDLTQQYISGKISLDEYNKKFNENQTKHRELSEAHHALESVKKEASNNPFSV